MTKTSAEEILRTLCYAPNGMTAVEMAERFGAVKATIGSRLSKMSLYGKIDRERIMKTGGQRPVEYRYYAKPGPSVE